MLTHNAIKIWVDMKRMIVILLLMQRIQAVAVAAVVTLAAILTDAIVLRLTRLVRGVNLETIGALHKQTDLNLTLMLPSTCLIALTAMVVFFPSQTMTR